MQGIELDTDHYSKCRSRLYRIFPFFQYRLSHDFMPIIGPSPGWIRFGATGRAAVSLLSFFYSPGVSQRISRRPGGKRKSRSEETGGSKASKRAFAPVCSANFCRSVASAPAASRAESAEILARKSSVCSLFYGTERSSGLFLRTNCPRHPERARGHHVQCASHGVGSSNFCSTRVISNGTDGYGWNCSGNG